jgi:hypothetical protein
VAVLQIVSGDDADHPEDSPEAMRRRVAAGGRAGPFLHDATQSAAQAYGATATPEVFVLDREGIVRYHGAPDGDYDDPAQNAAWVRDALDDVLAGRAVARPSTSPAGCSIKWRVELLWWEGLVGGGGRAARPPPDAERLGVPGSPTFQVGGRDLFPTEAPPALTCRVYTRADGRSGPLPDGADLSDRLRDVLARPWELPGWVDFRAQSA